MSERTGRKLDNTSTKGSTFTSHTRGKWTPSISGCHTLSRAQHYSCISQLEMYNPESRHEAIPDKHKEKNILFF